MFQAKWRHRAPLFFTSIVILLAIVISAFPTHCIAYDSDLIKKHTHVNDLFQDKKGFVWLAGQQGLTRFDGKNSIKFSSENPNSPLPFKWIKDLEQHNELLILATETHGLYSFNTTNSQYNQLVKPNGSIFRVSFFDNKYYFLTKNSLYVYQLSDKKIKEIATNINIDKMVKTQKNLYLSSDDGLFKLKNNRLTKINNQAIHELISTNDTIIAVSNDALWSINDNGSKNSSLIKETIYKAATTSDNKSFITINSLGELNKYTISTLTKERHRYKREKSTRVRSLLHDNSGSLWLSTNLGVERLYENNIINHEKTFDIAINANEITTFDNELIIGSYGVGLQNLFSRIFDQQTNINFTRLGLKNTSLDVVNNKLFIGTFDGVWQLDNKTKQVERLTFIDNDKLVLRLRSYNNILYIATDSNGLYAYDLENKKILWNIQLTDGLSSSEIIDILPLDNGRIWIATAKGLDIYDINTRSIENIQVPDVNKLVSVVFANNKIFAASLGNGIFAFNRHGELLAHIGEGISFSGLLVHEETVWAAARPGLYRLSVKSHQLSMIENTSEYSFVGSSVVHNNALYSSYYGGFLELDLTEQPIYHSKVIISKTTVSGKSYLLNKTIEVESSNDVITLDLASLDYRDGLTKKYQYKINNSFWQPISGSQLTLTGLASGEYSIEIMATNSLGQWSNVKAYADIYVAYPWYWTPQIKVFYIISALFLILLTSWLLYLRTKSISHIHNLLKDDMRNCGKLMKTTERNLELTLASINSNEMDKTRTLIEKSLSAMKQAVKTQEPDNLAGSTLAIAIPFLGSYIDNKYDVKLHYSLDENIDSVRYELKADIYKVIFEALMSSIFKSSSIKFDLSLQEVKGKFWLTINSDNNSFNQFDSKVNFDLASYTIRQIMNKHQASLNTFVNDDGSSQLVISFPLMTLT